MKSCRISTPGRPMTTFLKTLQAQEPTIHINTTQHLIPPKWTHFSSYSCCLFYSAGCSGWCETKCTRQPYKISSIAKTSGKGWMSSVSKTAEKGTKGIKKRSQKGFSRKYPFKEGTPNLKSKTCSSVSFSCFLSPFCWRLRRTADGCGSTTSRDRNMMQRTKAKSPEKCSKLPKLNGK